MHSHFEVRMARLRGLYALLVLLSGFAGARSSEADDYPYPPIRQPGASERPTFRTRLPKRFRRGK